MYSEMNDIGAYIKAVLAGYKDDLTAGGGGDGSKVTGNQLDRLKYQSAKVVVAYNATLASTETLKLKVEIEDSSDDGSSWNTAETIYADAVVATGGSGGSTETGVIEIDLDLAKYERDIRISVTPTFSAASTDTADLHWTLIKGGATEIPAS